MKGSGSVLTSEELQWEDRVSSGRGAGQDLIELDLRRGVPYRLLSVVSHSF